MRLLRLLPEKPAFDFMRWNRVTATLSCLLVLSSIALVATRGLNLGIDFVGGVLMEVETTEPADISGLRTELGALNLGSVSIQEFGNAQTVLIRVQRQDGGEAAQQEAVAQVKAVLDDRVREYRRTEVVGPVVGAELMEAALLAIGTSLLAIMVYIWFRFEWQFGVGAIIALAHDIIATAGLFALLQLEFNLATVAAILAIAGYSINDTVIIYDRVRENLRKYKKMPLRELYNLSINETLSRTIVTSGTTLLAVLALAIFGGEVIRNFAVALIWGISIGTYSSIAVAVALLGCFPTHRFDDAEAAE